MSAGGGCIEISDGVREFGLRLRRRVEFVGRELVALAIADRVAMGVLGGLAVTLTVVPVAAAAATAATPPAPFAIAATRSLALARLRFAVRLLGWDSSPAGPSPLHRSFAFGSFAIASCP